jgi:hypothetical protein
MQFLNFSTLLYWFLNFFTFSAVSRELAYCVYRKSIFDYVQTKECGTATFKQWLTTADPKKRAGVDTTWKEEEKKTEC